MLGKQKCKILKEIRQKIADENDIPYVTRECTHQGNCSGTCPKCESELRYLENQLRIRSSLGKKIKVAALCAGMALTAAGCSTISTVIGNNKPADDLSGMVAYETPVPTQQETEEVFVTEGEVPWTPRVEESQTVVLPTQAVPVEIEEIELMGDVPYFEESGING